MAQESESSPGVYALTNIPVGGLKPVIKLFGVRFPAPLSPLGYGLESISKFHITNAVPICVSVKDPDQNNLRFLVKSRWSCL